MSSLYKIFGKKFMKKLILLAFLTIFISCSSHRSIVPLGKGNSSVSAGIGGPVVKAFDIYTPMPYITGGLSYGLTDNIDISADLHLTSLFYQIGGLDFGCAWYLTEQKNFVPVVSLQPKVNIFASFKSNVDSRFRVLPSLSTNFAWKLKEDYIFTGLELTTPFSSSDYDNNSQKIMLSPYIGYRYAITEKFGIIAELKLTGANIKTNQLTVTYLNLFNFGSFGTFFTFDWRF